MGKKELNGRIEIKEGNICELCEYARRQKAIEGIEKGMVRKLGVLEYCGNCSQLYRLFKSD